MLSRCRSRSVLYIAIFLAVVFSVRAYVYGAEQPAGQPAAKPASDLEKTVSFDLGKDVKLEMILIPAGSFVMGDADGSEDQKPAHKVNITRPFYMSKYKITLAQFEALMGSRRGRFGGGPPPAGSSNTTNEASKTVPPSSDAAGTTAPPSNAGAPAASATTAPQTGDAARTPRGGGFSRTPQDPKNPTSFTTWESCQSYVAKLNEKLADSGGKFSLPSEAQWEYACRAGATTKYSFGDTPENADEYGWFRPKSEGKAHPVGEKKPNAWGLYDMQGDVWEWVNDWYDRDYYKTSPTDDPPGPTSGTAAVLRGGGWNDDPMFGSCVFRNRNVVRGASNDQGFRVVFAR